MNTIEEITARIKEISGPLSTWPKVKKQALPLLDLDPKTFTKKQQILLEKYREKLPLRQPLSNLKIKNLKSKDDFSPLKRKPSGFSNRSFASEFRQNNFLRRR